MPLGLFGLGVGGEPLAAPGPAHAPTLPLSGRPHARAGAPSRAPARLFFFQLLTRCQALAHTPERLVVSAAAPRIHAGLGPRHPGAGDLLPRLAGSHHPAAEEGTGTRHRHQAQAPGTGTLPLAAADSLGLG